MKLEDKARLGGNRELVGSMQHPWTVTPWKGCLKRDKAVWKMSVCTWSNASSDSPELNSGPRSFSLYVSVCREGRSSGSQGKLSQDATHPGSWQGGGLFGLICSRSPSSTLRWSRSQGVEGVVAAELSSLSDTRFPFSQSHLLYQAFGMMVLLRRSDFQPRKRGHQIRTRWLHLNTQSPMVAVTD